MPTPEGIEGEYFDYSNVDASVKVMRSHDYCHFEVCLSASGMASVQEVDELRKTAARLADKAVEQYKIAKENFARMESAQRDIDYLLDEEQRILAKPETERTPEEQALVKVQADRRFQLRRYDYEDDWQDGDED